ncbi:Pre-mRNA 3'-end-processing factor FIP1, partial [Cathartes aura]
EDDSDSDSDDDEDDVQVTIGDIKTGAPQYGYGAAPVNLNIKTGGRAYGSSGAKVKGVDLDAPGSINGVPLLEVDLDSFEDKPWRKPGADLSDYFNYGFNEDTWKAYCEKQKRIRMGLEILPVTSTTNKIT